MKFAWLACLTILLAPSMPVSWMSMTSADELDLVAFSDVCTASTTAPRGVRGESASRSPRRGTPPGHAIHHCLQCLHHLSALGMPPEGAHRDAFVADATAEFNPGCDAARCAEASYGVQARAPPLRY